MPQIRPQRADILPAGLIIVDAACDRLGIDALRVSHADLLAGYLRSAQYRSIGEVPGARNSLSDAEINSAGQALG
jgi:exopolyphosphatase/pppGpp-phosphohydrolase